MSMITATTWVPRGYAARHPTKYVFDEEEFERISSLAQLQLEDAKEDLDDAKKAESKKTSSSGSKEKNGTGAGSEDEMDDDLKEFDLEHYDDDDDEDEEGAGDNMGMFASIKSLAYHESNADDPYITLPEGEGEDDDEREDLEILPTDNVVLAARLEDEVAHLEVYVYEDEADNLYVHHDIMLPAIPLAVEWINYPVGQPEAATPGKGSFVAIGTMDPDIELWDLDTVDTMYPNAVLGQGSKGANEQPDKKKKKKKSKKANDEYHVDSVLSLAANRNHSNLLASASADATLKLWDLNTAKCAKSYTYHTDKVCSLAWNSVESTILLSGSYDRTVVAADMRAPDATPPRWAFNSDPEIVKWDPHSPNLFYVATEDGIIHHYDARVTPSSPSDSKAIWTLQAHDASISSFDINPIIPGYLVTGSTDKTVKLWNVQEAGPSMVISRDLGVGKVFSTTFAPDKAVGFRLAVAGSKGSVQIWDTSTNAAVRRAFGTRVAPVNENVKERLVRIEEDDDDSGDDDDGAAEGGQEGWESMEE